MWVIANFVEENNVEVVPHCWMDGDECFWPTLPRDKLKKYIEKLAKHDPNDEIWKKYKARTIGRPYDDLQKAREKSNIALVRSDIETDSENQKRIIKKNKRFFIDDDSSSSPGPEELSQSPENISPKRCKKTLWPQFNSREIKKPSTDFPQLRTSPRKLLSKSSSEGFKIGILGQNSPSSPMPASSSYAITSPRTTFKHHCFKNLASLKNGLRSLWNEISLMNAKLDMIINHLNLKNDVNEAKDESNFQDILPISTMDDLLAFDASLQDKTKETELVNLFARIGGSNVADSCRRALRATLQDEVACKFSWVGQKGKSVFSSLHLKTVLFKAGVKQFNSATEKEMETVVKDWLRPSRYRLLSKDKSRKRSCEATRNEGECEEANKVANKEANVEASS